MFFHNSKVSSAFSTTLLGNSDIGLFFLTKGVTMELEEATKFAQCVNSTYVKMLPHGSKPLLCFNQSYGQLWLIMTVVESSFVTKFDLVCDDFYLRGVMNSMMMVGMLLGSMPIGMISDRFGRKVALLTCLIVQPLAGIVGAFSPWLPLLAFCRILIGMAIIGNNFY